MCNSKERSVRIVGKCVSKKIRIKEKRKVCQRWKQAKLGLEEKHISNF